MSTPTTSVIHDIGYKPYAGPRLGRPQILRALYVHGLRACFGFGRGPKAKIVPWFVLLVMLIPAALNVYVASTGKALVMDYAKMGTDMALFTVLFVAVAAPNSSRATCATTPCRCTSPGRCAAATTRWPSCSRSSAACCS